MMQAKGAAMDSFTVLLVEDNADDEFLASWVLQKAGIQHLSVARDGSEALDILYGSNRSPGTVPDLLILDLRLPKIGGIELLGRIRADARTMALPVLIVSSSEDPGDRESCRQLGIIDFVSKPLKAAAVRKVVNLIGSG
jgi:two-component system, response regulator